MAIDLKSIQKEPSLNNTQLPKGSLLQLEISLGPVFPMRQKEIFYREIALMLGSGLMLKDALELLAQEQSHPKRKLVLLAVAQSIKKGLNLEKALNQSGAFSDYECISISMGEESGRLPEVILQLAEYFNNRVAQKRTLSSALTYPMVILATSFGAVGFMMIFMVPMFRDVFARTGKELPAITQIVVQLSDIIVASWGWALLLLSILVGGLYSQRKSHSFLKYKSIILSNMPVVGSHFRTGSLMQWTGAMALMLESGVPLVQSLRLCARLTTDHNMQTTLGFLEDRLMHGDNLHEAMSGQKLFDGRLVLMVKVAEEAHALDRVFKQLAEQYRADMEHRSKMMGTLLEPFIILFLGVVVGFILLAMYLPIFEMGTV